MLLPPLAEEAPEDVRRELDDDDAQGPESPEVEDAGINDYVDHDVDWDPTVNPANPDRPDAGFDGEAAGRSADSVAVNEVTS